MDLQYYNPDTQVGENTGWFWKNSYSGLYSASSGYAWLGKKLYDWNDQENWDYPKSREIWKRLPFGDSSHLNLMSWIHRSKNLTSVLFFVAIWWIWRNRNNDLFNNEEMWSSVDACASFMIFALVSYLEEESKKYRKLGIKKQRAPQVSYKSHLDQVRDLAKRDLAKCATSSPSSP
ncbi:hypothetical protein PIB30_080520 [Stylosanthes scabra]|uniref:Uncharacterized protein n=1 Tax=Stylosanthes scabra TaxID=79078 RepID=A0ABU6WPN8_9FABA|nr:hypothetical protein [Stylosanthes scabra]